MADSAGMADDTHGGELTVLQAGAGEAADSWTPTGVEIPVAFAAVPGNGSSAASRRRNGVTIDSRPRKPDTCGAGEEIKVRVNFADPVEVAGSPALALGVGNGTPRAAWSERGCSSLDFRYAVQAGDRDADGISIAADALALSGDSIRNRAGVDADLDLGGDAVPDDSRHRMDGGG